MKMRSIALSTAIATSLIGTAAFAGGKNDVIVAPTPAAPPVAVAPVVPAGSWTGGYAGLSFGGLRLDQPGRDDTNPVYGLHGGYDYQYGRNIIGGELDIQFADEDFGGVEIDQVTRLKLRAGYDLGDTMLYTTAGVAQLNSSLGDSTGAVGGFGGEYKLTDSFSVGAEYLAHGFKDVGDTGTDVRADTLSLRANFRF